MTWRGRGCLEIGESSNPFFQPVSAEIGRTSRNSPTVDWTVTGSPKKVKPPYKVDGNFDFLYTRESDVIGSRVHKPQSLDLKMPTRTEFLKQRRLQAYEKMISSRGNSPDGNTGHRTQSPGSTQSFYEEDDDEDFNLTKARRFKMAAEDILSAYKHQPKNEDPRYTTTNVSTTNHHPVCYQLTNANNFTVE